MAGRRRSTAGKPDGEGQASQPVSDDTGPGDIAVSEQFAESGPVTPVSRIRVRGADDEPPARFAGHVLTDRGWKVE